MGKKHASQYANFGSLLIIYTVWKLDFLFVIALSLAYISIIQLIAS